MEKGMVSVTIPVYNRQEYIRECIESVFAQSYQNFEIIIVDDGSTDNTLQICRELQEQDSRIKLLQGAHKGVSAARNQTLEAVSGEYVFFLDSDDAIHPKLLETFVNALEQTGAAIAGTVVQSIPHTSWHKLPEFIEKQGNSAETVYHDHADTLHAVFHGTTPLGNIGGVMIRSCLIGQTRFRTDLYIGEDFFFIYENLIKGADAVFLKQRWYYARIHKHNTSNSFTFDGFWTRFLRRKLVWESEDRLGRPENAKVHKRDAVSVFHRCLLKDIMDKAEKKKMLQVMKQHKKQLLKAQSLKGKVLFLASLYVPALYVRYARIRKEKKGNNSIW